jgi:hypothetical protein
MTLILSVVTHQHLIQASDRRLVWFRHKKVVKRDDYRNKAVCWRGRMTLAYTGLAQVGPKRRTDLWLADVLLAEAVAGQTDHGFALEHLADAATAEFLKPYIGKRIPPELRRHAFVAIGWASFDGGQSMDSYIAYVSNFHDVGPDGVQMLSSAKPEFHYYYAPLLADHALRVETLGGVSPRRFSAHANVWPKHTTVANRARSLMCWLPQSARKAGSTTPWVGEFSSTSFPKRRLALSPTSL